MLIFHKELCIILIQGLERRLELELKSHQSEVRILKNKNKQLSSDIEGIRQNSKTVHSKLKVYL